MTTETWSAEVELLRIQGFSLAPGLDPDEFAQAEKIHGFRFPPDLRSFLSCVLPQGPRFPNWRQPSAEELLAHLAWPLDGFAFDIEHNGFWWEPWGPRPAKLTEAIVRAATAVKAAPLLIPIFGHRYLPAEPIESGNPVFSVHQTDIIYYGLGLRRYLRADFGGMDYSEAVGGEPRRIRFWSDVVDANG